MTTYPFEIPKHLLAAIPPAASDGNVYVDVKFRGCWDGVLVINNGRCIGVLVAGDTIECRMPFAPEEMEGIRPACIANRILANLPEGADPYSIAVVTVWIVCPILLTLGLTFNIWLLLLLIPIIVGGLGAMYSVSGFPLTRFPTSLLALAMLIVAMLALGIHWFA